MDVLTLNVSILTQHEVLGYLQRVNIILASETIDPDDPVFRLRKNFMESVHNFDLALKPSGRSSYTEEIQRLRILRLD